MSAVVRRSQRVRGSYRYRSPLPRHANTYVLYGSVMKVGTELTNFRPADFALWYTRRGDFSATRGGTICPPQRFLVDDIWGRRRLGYNVGVEYLSAPTRRCSSTSGIALLFLLSLGPLPGLCCCASACPCRLVAACLTFVVSSCRFLFATWPPRAGLATF